MGKEKLRDPKNDMDTCFLGKELEDKVICVLQYYSLFHYPLTAAEVYSNFPVRVTLTAIYTALQRLVADGSILQHQEFYSLEADVINLVGKRRIANKLALVKIEDAEKKAALIYSFPFVRFVGISGSLSKGYADEHTDYDFFIVTETNRLWLCRTLLHVFKKFTFLAGLQHRFCMNYFIDMDKLVIEEQNRFTSIELATLLPAKGKEVFMSFMQANCWVYKYLPNHFSKFMLPQVPADKKKKVAFKGMLEFIFNHIAPERVNELLMQLTDEKWRRKWAKKNYPESEYGLAFKTTIHASKNHAANYQKRVLDKLPERFRYTM